jgi:hypothetical protein
MVLFHREKIPRFYFQNPLLRFVVVVVVVVVVSFMGWEWD